MDAGSFLPVIVVAALVALYVAFVVRRLRARAERRGVARGSPGAPPSRVSRADRKSAALAGTTQVRRPDFDDAAARVLANAARLAGQDADTSDPAGASPTSTPPTPEDSSLFTTPAASATPGSMEASIFVPSTAAAPEPAPRALTVAELLAGIRLPDYLAPVTDMAPRPSVHDRVAFIATGPTADVVAPEFAAELTRLGFTLTPVGYNTLELVRGPDRATVVVHAAAAQALIDGIIAFPTSPPHGVIVEVWIPAFDA